MVKPGQWFSRNCYTFCSLIFSIICTSFIYHIFKFYTHQPSPTNQPNNRCLRIGEMEPQEFERLAKSGKHLETIRASEGMWTIEATGRLGNLMGEYATLYALAKWNNKQAYVVPVMHSQLAKMFKLTLPALHQETNSRIPWSIHGLHDWMTEDYKSIKGDYIKFLSTPCSWTFFHHIRDEIYREYSFHDYIKKEINEYLSKARGNRANVTFVGVHVRRGDYIHVMPNQWRGVIADKAYLDKAMGYFQNKYANVLFVVASNGMDWCKENIDTSKGDVHFAGDGKEGSPDRDFAILAHCNHTIMTIGTFGFWVSYLVGGETIYLTNYTLPDSAFLKVFRYEAAFLPEWIGIPADLSPLLKKP